MLYYWLHILYIYVGAKFFWSKIDLISDLTRKRNVKLLDCDALRFMANSKYFYYMDFIRLELLFRSKLYDVTFKKGIYPVLGGQKIMYKNPLKRWSKFNISLTVEGWDDKWVYHRQTFTQNGKIMAIGFTKVAFWENHKALDMREILHECGVKITEMNPPENVLNMFGKDREIIKSLETL